MLYAGIDSNNIVYQLVDIPDNLEDPLAYIATELQLSGTWLPAFAGSDGSPRYCGIGYLYVEQIGGFVPPKPFPSWILDERHIWVPPVPHPGDGLYTWNEAETCWLRIEIGLNLDQ